VGGGGNGAEQNAVSGQMMKLYID
jgi:hypothetical protein